jgi:bifunctional non-homologous end joining protein LigD
LIPIIEPIAPVLSKTVPIGREWLYEVKLDGFRGTLYIEHGRAWFRSKNKNRMRRFDDLALSISANLSVRDAVFDGEIVVMSARGPEFYQLMFRKGVPQYAAFDLLWLNGRDLRDRPYARRKIALRKVLLSTSAIGYVEEHPTPALFESAARMDLEGIVAKRRSDPYASGVEWVKVKHPRYTQAEGRADLFRRR